MKVIKLEAFKSDDGCIWEKEKEAIEQNLVNIFDLAEVNSDDNYCQVRDKIFAWVKNNPKEIKYFINNINKIT